MATENEPVAPTRVDALIDCWLSGQIPEADMIARLREDELLRRRFERRLGRQLTL